MRRSAHRPGAPLNEQDVLSRRGSLHPPAPELASVFVHPPSSVEGIAPS
jgi:hypothetical protein